MNAPAMIAKLALPPPGGVPRAQVEACFDREEVPAAQPHHAVRRRPKDSVSNCLIGSVPYHLIY